MLFEKFSIQKSSRDKILAGLATLAGASKENDIAALCQELEKLRESWQACLWVQSQAHYPVLSLDTRRAESEALARMRRRAEEIKTELRQSGENRA